MKITKLVAIRISPVLIIMNGNGDVIGEEMAPTSTIYPGQDLNKIIKELKSLLEVVIPDDMPFSH